MDFPKIYSASGLMELIGEIGFLPLLDSGIDGFSADAIATPSHRAADANICPTLSHVPQVGQVGQMGQVGQPKADWRRPVS